MDRTLPSATRRWAGAISLPLFFLAMIGATLADPVEDETAGPAEQLHQAAAHLGRLQTTFVLELLAAVFFLGRDDGGRRRGSAAAARAWPTRARSSASSAASGWR